MAEALATILENCKKGQALAQQQLYRLCFEPMYKVCLRYNSNEQDATNCYNEAMYAVLTKINQFNFEGAFMGWVRRIMVNTCLNAIKRNKKFEYKEIDDFQEKDFSSENNILEKQDSNEILALVQKLPKQTSLVFNLFVMENYSYKEISELLGININTTKWHLHNGRTLLKEALIKKWESETNLKKEII